VKRTSLLRCQVNNEGKKFCKEAAALKVGSEQGDQKIEEKLPNFLRSSQNSCQAKKMPRHQHQSSI
jgi:hypothetical protein